MRSTEQAYVRCRVAGAAMLRGAAPAIAQWRRQPPMLGAVPLSASFLKHADEQTVLALAAVADVIASNGWRNRSFAQWGAVAAPNLFGRAAIALSIQRFHQDGAWGVSPHLIPHQSLHALSGTLSQALKMNGPNFGSGGGPNAAPDALLLAAALLADGQLPGLWLILSGHESEWIPGAAEAPACLAAAFALAPFDPHAPGATVTLGARDSRPDCQSDPSALFTLAKLAEAWTPGAPLPSGRWRLSDDYGVEIASPPVAREVAA